MYSLINPTDLEQKLFRRTFHEFAHPEFISWVPTEWLLEIANPEYLSTTTKHRDGDDGDRVTLDELYEILLHEGMRDPFVIAFGRKTGRFRLDEGNQRVRLFAQYAITQVPVICIVGDTHIVHPRNGTHDGLPWIATNDFQENGLAVIDLLLPDIHRTT